MPRTLSFQLEDADPNTFTGTAFIRLMASAAEDEFIRLYHVRFEPGARTNWHSHSGDQVLITTSGMCVYQIEDGPVVPLPEGHSVRFPAGIRHWHGAPPDRPGEHTAINLDVRETSWLEPVSDAEYGSGATPGTPHD